MSAVILRHLFSLLPTRGLPPSWPACVRPCLSCSPGSQAQLAPSMGLRQPLPAPAQSWQPWRLPAKHNHPAVDTVVDFQEGREEREGRREREVAKAFNASLANLQLVLAILHPLQLPGRGLGFQSLGCLGHTPLYALVPLEPTAPYHQQPPHIHANQGTTKPMSPRPGTHDS